jgi:hypothetical protein
MEREEEFLMSMQRKCKLSPFVCKYGCIAKDADDCFVLCEDRVKCTLPKMCEGNCCEPLEEINAQYVPMISKPGEVMRLCPSCAAYINNKGLHT